MPWMLRAAWLVAGVAGSSALDDALADHGRAGSAVVQVLAGALWVGGVLAMAVPAVVTLTIARSLVPLSLPALVAVWIGGGGPAATTVGLAAAALATAIAFSPELGRAFVQASAYGEEDRHLLRPPAAYLAAAVLAWVLAAAGVTTGGVLLAEERWVAGLGVFVAAAAIGGWASRRWHRLSRRWLVVVPVGVVIHDHLVLSETLMLRRGEIAAVGLAPADTVAADLTGPAGGHAIEITTTESVTAIYAGTPEQPGGTAIHLTACLVAPTRPGRALAAVRRRR